MTSRVNAMITIFGIFQQKNKTFYFKPNCFDHFFHKNVLLRSTIFANWQSSNVFYDKFSS
jgi:hypothetical protein